MPGLLLILAFARESKLVLRLAIRDLVDAEPLIGSPQETREMAFDILDVVELVGKGVVHVNDNDLPVSLFLVEESHDTQNLDLLDLASVTNQFTNLADVEGVIVALGLGLWVNNVGVFPGLSKQQHTI